LSLWDDFKDTLQDYGNNLKSGLNFGGRVQTSAISAVAAGQVSKQASMAGLDPQSAFDYVDTSVAKSTGANVDQITGAVVSPMEEVFTTLDKYVYQPTYEAAGFAALMANQDTYSQEDEYTNAIARAWDGRKEISFGQAIADNFAGTYNMLPDWGALAEINNVDINIYNDQMREKVYTRTYNEAGERVDSQGNKLSEPSWAENVFRVVSGTLDVGKQLVLDPLVFAGKGMKVARLSKLDVFRKDAIVNTKEWGAHQATHNASDIAVAEQKLALVNDAPELSRAKSVLDEIENKRMFDDGIKAEVNYVREINGKKPLAESLDTTVFVDDYRDYIKSLEDKVLERQTKIDELNSLEAPKPTLATGVSDFVRQIVDRQMTWQEINAHRTIREFGTDSEFLAVALAEAAKKGEGAVTDVLLIAQGSDPSAYFRLQNQQQSFIRLIDAAQTKMDDVEIMIQHAINSNDQLTIKRMNDQKVKLSEYITDLRKEDTYLDRLLRSDNSIVGSLTGVPVSNSGKLSPIIESYRANKAIVRAGLEDGTIKPLAVRAKSKPDSEFRWERIQKSKLYSPVYVAQWVGHTLGREKPSGIVTIDGLDYYDGVKELRVFLDNTPVFDGNVELKNSLMDAYVNAPNALARKKVLQDSVEKEVIRLTAEKYGIADTITKVAKDDGTVVEMPMWEFVYNKFLQDRALAVAEFKKNKVFNVHADGSKAANPVLESQLDYAVPMMDTDAFDKYMSGFAADKNTWDTIAMGTRQVKDEWIMPLWSTADRFWRADVLIRLGYPQRNVLSEWMVLSQYDLGLSKLFGRATMSQAGKNFASNRYSYFQDLGGRYQAALDIAESTGSSATAARLRSLTPKQVDWGDYEKFASDNIATLQDERQGIIDLADELLENPDLAGQGYVFPTEAIARLDAQIDLEYKKLAEVAKRVAAKGQRFGTQKTIGKTTVRIGPKEFAGVYEGAQGQAARSLISSGGRINFDSSPVYSALEEMGLQRTGNFTDIAPTDDAYFSSLATVVNQQFRGSRTAMQIIQGKSDSEILEYLRSPEGKLELQKLNWEQDLSGADLAGKTRKVGKVKVGETDLGQPLYRYDGGEVSDAASNYLDYAKSMVNHYLPNDDLKLLVRERLATDTLGRGEGAVTTAELRIASRNADLNSIHGETLESAGIWSNPKLSAAEKLNKSLTDILFRRVFKVIGEYPEDAFVSTPFAQAVYTKKLDDIMKTWEANGIEATDLDMAQAQTIARKWAVKQSREYLYRVVRKNSIGDSIPLIAPFFQAQFSTMKRVGKLAYRNPDQSARVIYAWNQINTHASQDAEGNRWLMWRIPPSYLDDKGLSKAVPPSLRNALKSQNEWRWNANSFNLLLAGLRVEAPDVLPGQEEETIDKVARWAKTAQSIVGTGPFIQIPANKIIKDNPALDREATEFFGVPVPLRSMIEVFASPYPSDKWYAPLQSAWNRRAGTLLAGDKEYTDINGSGNNDFERTQLVMFQNHLDRIRTGEEQPLSDDPLTNDEMLWKLAAEEASAFTALRLVVNLTSGFIPTYEGPMSGYVELYRSYQTKYGMLAYDKWLEHYPDMGYIAVSRSKNLSGSSASKDAVYNRMEHNVMIEKALKDSGLNREESLPFIQMITNKDVGAPVLRDPHASYWQKKTGDRTSLTAEEGYENQQERDGWAKFFLETEAYEKELKARGITRYANAADGLNKARDAALYDIGKTNPVWWQKYSALGGDKSPVAYVRMMKVALNDEKFMSTLPEDSWWYDMEGIIEERDALIEATRDSGRKSPPKEWKEAYAEAIAPYLANETTKYYYYKFLENDTFVVDQPK
jgi:hypothetical protein